MNYILGNSTTKFVAYSFRNLLQWRSNREIIIYEIIKYQEGKTEFLRYSECQRQCPQVKAENNPRTISIMEVTQL
jgi:hypothetical protein